MLEKHRKVRKSGRCFSSLAFQCCVAEQPFVDGEQGFKNYVVFAPKYELEKLKDELGEDSQCCLLVDISIELVHNRCSRRLHKPLKSNKFKSLSRTR